MFDNLFLNQVLSGTSQVVNGFDISSRQFFILLWKVLHDLLTDNHQILFLYEIVYHASKSLYLAKNPKLILCPNQIKSTIKDAWDTTDFLGDFFMTSFPALPHNDPIYLFDVYIFAFCSGLSCDIYLNDKISLLDSSCDIVKKYLSFCKEKPIAQKSTQWYNVRQNMITASSVGSILGLNKYQSRYQTLLEKVSIGSNFTENKFVYHGKKYEKIASLIYEHVFNVKVGEFGFFVHDAIPFIGASPDGIVTPVRLDGTLNTQTANRLIEIKCPLSRSIVTKGHVYDKICPSYYWAQIQIQLEVCDVSECDFWQCKIIEVDKEQWNKDHLCKSYFSEHKVNLSIDPRLTRGIILEYYPNSFIAQNKYDHIKYYAKHIYPWNPRMSRDEYEQWAETMSQSAVIDQFTFTHVLYWQLHVAHMQTIPRDTEWFKKNYPSLEDFWKAVCYYKKHPRKTQYLLKNKPKKTQSQTLLKMFETHSSKADSELKIDHPFCEFRADNIYCTS
ncbi:putative YqaJ-like viral recombinase [Namao virus]|nr:putative YqaJ-like viral recombinase [Namao virus]